MPAGFSLAGVKVKIWILNTENSPGQWILNDLWHFQYLCFILGHSHNLFTYSFTQQRFIVQQHAGIVGCGWQIPTGRLSPLTLNPLMTYCRNRHANSNGITLFLAREGDSMGAEIKVSTSGRDNRQERKGGSLLFQGKQMLVQRPKEAGERRGLWEKIKIEE